MKLVIYGILIAAAMLVPTRPLELGKLKPVEVIKIDVQGEMIRIETDTGDTGSAATLKSALQDLKATAPGIIYLDTAEYMLLPKGKEALLAQVRPYLKDSVQICCWEGEIDMKEVAAFLNAHSPENELKQYQKGMPIKTLVAENRRLKFEEKNIEIR